MFMPEHLHVHELYQELFLALVRKRHVSKLLLPSVIPAFRTSLASAFIAALYQMQLLPCFDSTLPITWLSLQYQSRTET